MDAHSVGLEEHHHITDRALLVPGRNELLGARPPKPWDLAQSLGLLLEHLQRIEPEARHDALSRDATDAFDEAGSQVPFDARERGRRELHHAGRTELLAVRAVDLHRPASANA